MRVDVPPVTMPLPQGGELLIQTLPPTLDAAEDFLAVHHEAYLHTYDQMPCIDAKGIARHIQPEDMIGIVDPEDKRHVAHVARVAGLGFDPTATESRLLLQGTVVQEDDVYVAGVVNVWFGSLVRPLANATTGSVAELHEIDVLPWYMNRGIGKAMLARAVDLAAEQFDSGSLIQLQVATANAKARMWYDRLGFAVVRPPRQATWPNGIQIEIEERITTLAGLNARLTH